MREMEFPREGYVDQPYQIVSQRNAKFSRADIAEFIFKLQTGTNPAIDAAAASGYAETGSNIYVLCRQI